MLTGYKKVGYNRIFTGEGYHFFVPKTAKTFMRKLVKGVRKRFWRMMKYRVKVGELPLPSILYKKYHTTDFELLFYFQIETHKKALRRLPWGIIRYFATLHNVPNPKVLFLFLDHWVPGVVSRRLYPFLELMRNYALYYTLVFLITRYIELYQIYYVIRYYSPIPEYYTRLVYRMTRFYYRMSGAIKPVVWPVLRPIVRPARKVARFL